MKVIEVFRSIQGEGALHFCSPAVFVRFAGCSKKCKICDTKYAWEEGKDYSPEDLATEVLEWLPLVEDSESRGLLVLTGGEPLEQTIAEMIDFLSLVKKDFAVKVHLETGRFDKERLFWLLPYLDSVCISFKQGMDDFSEHSEFLGIVLREWWGSTLLELKFVITDSKSFDLEKVKRFVFVEGIKFISFQPECGEVTLRSSSEALTYMKMFENFVCELFGRFGRFRVFEAPEVVVLPQLHKLMRLS